MLSPRYSGHTQQKQEGKSTMWVYQETETNAAALVPTLPGRYSGRVSGRKRSHDACFRAADGNAASESSPAEAIPSQPGLHPSGGGCLFGTLMAGVRRHCAILRRWRRLPIIWTAGAECSRRPVPRRRWDCSGRAGCRPRGGGSVSSAGALGSGAVAYLSVCDVIRDRLRPALGAASE